MATTSKNVLFVLAEKVVTTYIEAFITLLLVHPLEASFAQSAAIAAIPAALTVLANGLPAVPVGLPFYLDLVLRALRTATVSFIGFLVAIPTFNLSYSVGVAAFGAAATAFLAVIKGGIASRVGSEASAALLPRTLDAPQVVPPALPLAA